MNPLRANFAELFERHLCRHSQYGINVGHLLCVVVTYLALYGLVFGLTGSIAPLVGLAVIYLGIVMLNMPVLVSLVTVLFTAAFFVVFLAIAPLPLWACVAAIVVSYKVQAWSHLYWDRACDMTEFDRKYPKGRALFILLSVYELPLLLNYLFVARPELPLPDQEVPLAAPVRQPERVA